MKAELTVTTTKMITDNYYLSHKKQVNGKVQNCEEMVWFPLFRFSFRIATVLFPK